MKDSISTKPEHYAFTLVVSVVFNPVVHNAAFRQLMSLMQRSKYAQLAG